MKKCPYCWEKIQDQAKKCKHCWEFLKEKPKQESRQMTILKGFIFWIVIFAWIIQLLLWNAMSGTFTLIVWVIGIIVALK